LAYFAEIPAVVWDVQRVGPSTGLPTHTSQGDLAFAHSLGHGDTDFIILLPSTVGECFEFGWRALDIADRMQAPIIVLSDLDLGMNLWMSGPFEYPRTPIDKGKILWENGLDDYKEKYTQEYGRYLDVDGDGIPYRTVPGNMHPDAAYFTRGTGHDEKAHYSEKAETWEENLNRLKRKFEKTKEIIPEPIVERNHSSVIGIIAYGSTHFPVFEAVQEFSNNVVDLDYLRIRALPWGSEVKTFIKNHKKVIVIENNRDGQLLQILCSVYPKQASKFVKLSKCDGMSLSAKWIIEKLEELKLEEEV
jgi:2-oxoglutarate ferredoxin oxidoreductase subunit alpha